MYLCASTSIKETLQDGLAGEFTHYINKHDNRKWLDKNSRGARGEGTSAQGAISATGTRLSAHSAKAKGKDPDVVQPMAITVDVIVALVACASTCRV